MNARPPEGTGATETGLVSNGPNVASMVQNSTARTTKSIDVSSPDAISDFVATATPGACCRPVVSALAMHFVIRHLPLSAADEPRALSPVSLGALRQAADGPSTDGGTAP